ncbi:hypothetical protein JG687_00013394 [Phytophthora cactorum]|uniref:Uncharacterized protein n=1 Tax=Phytophthora cactorum TaxID=29920 RepID=A0A8T1U1E4_9STRA|nr:hypothetical protein JG687_00013394 [Phytophthora cactorum]
METLKTLRAHFQAEITQNISRAAAAVSIQAPCYTYPPSDEVVDTAMANFLSNLAEASSLRLPEFIRLVWGQTADDPRPNKDPYDISSLPQTELREICSH